MSASGTTRFPGCPDFLALQYTVLGLVRNLTEKLGPRTMADVFRHSDPQGKLRLLLCTLKVRQKIRNKRRFYIAWNTCRQTFPYPTLHIDVPSLEQTLFGTITI